MDAMEPSFWGRRKSGAFLSNESFVPREGVGHLPSDPLGSWIGGDANNDQPPAGVMQGHQAVEQLE
jgi:hypothetical protein